MEIILLERIAKLGQMGDIVQVKDGFARNYLLPQGKALRANAANKQLFEAQKAQLEARNLEEKKEAEGVSEKVDGQTFIIIRQAGDSGQLYGSVSTRDISDAVTEGGCSVERRQVMLDRPIKELGLHNVQINLHPEVEVSVIVNVARTEEEAERQARGESIRDEFDDDDNEPLDQFDADEIFEDEETAKTAQERLAGDNEDDGGDAADEQETAATQDADGEVQEGTETEADKSA